jgi:hypothetical protein
MLATVPYVRLLSVGNYLKALLLTPKYTQQQNNKQWKKRNGLNSS